MIPIIWRYLLTQYLKVLTLCVLTFIAILLTSRLNDIAHFAGLGADSLYVWQFVLYQIPYILPIVLPISALISAVLLIQRLSYSHELTAFRACGLAIRNILAPILFTAALLSLANFVITSELATTSHLATNFLKNEVKAINPLLLLRNKHLCKMQGIYFDTLGPSRIGEHASDVVMVTPNRHQGRLHVLIAKSMEASSDSFQGEGLTLISATDDGDDQFDTLEIENLGEAVISIDDFSQMFQKKVWKINADHLRMPLLLIRLSEAKEKLRSGTLDAKETEQTKQLINNCISEIFRRISVGLAVFAFTLMGAAFSMTIGRQQSSRGIFWVIGLAAMYLVCFFTAKGLQGSVILSSLLYLLPLVIIVVLSIWTLKRTTKGIE